jgi:hypothetical protein
MRVRARITDPAPGATINVGRYTVRGKAWSFKTFTLTSQAA